MAVPARNPSINAVTISPVFSSTAQELRHIGSTPDFFSRDAHPEDVYYPQLYVGLLHKREEKEGKTPRKLFDIADPFTDLARNSFHKELAIMAALTVGEGGKAEEIKELGSENPNSEALIDRLINQAITFTPAQEAHFKELLNAERQQVPIRTLPSFRFLLRLPTKQNVVISYEPLNDEGFTIQNPRVGFFDARAHVVRDVVKIGGEIRNIQQEFYALYEQHGGTDFLFLDRSAHGFSIEGSRVSSEDVVMADFAGRRR